jgi:hypothetical protein
MSKGVISIGIHAPIIREGDNLQQIVLDSILKTTELEDGDVIGITESVVARAQGNYVTVDEIAQETIRLFDENPTLYLLNPIYSRNRFSMILKGIARAAKKIFMRMPEYDEVGNPRGMNPWTGVNILNYYREICESEHCEIQFNPIIEEIPIGTYYIDCSLRPWKNAEYYKLRLPSLQSYFPEKCEWGLLGSNKANEETLKLFPNKSEAEKLVSSIQEYVKEKFGIRIEVMIYGDGAFKDPIAEIWEFADPITSPAYTSGLEGSPNELKLKAYADGRFKDLSGDALNKAIKERINHKDWEVKQLGTLKGAMSTQGTTPRRYIDLLASLMDLTSGSGDKGTPIVLVKNYFKNFASC